MAILKPEFPEIRFGAAVTRHLENCRIGAMFPCLTSLLRRIPRIESRIPLWDPYYIMIVLQRELGLPKELARAIINPYGPPVLPSTVFEKRFPVDMAMNANGIFYFLQYKRSTCVVATKHSGHKESSFIGTGDFEPLIYRVKFAGGKSGDKEQWKNLNDLQDKLTLASIDSAIVGYVAPAFHKECELKSFYHGGFFKLIDERRPITYIEPNAFCLPGTTSHWISFDGVNDTTIRFSSAPKDVPNVISLAEAIGRRAPNAPKLSTSITNLRSALDDFAKEKGLEDRPQKLTDRAFLSIFDIAVRREDESTPGDGEIESRRSVEIARAKEFLRGTSTVDVQESDLAEAIRTIMQYGEDGLDESRMSFLEDFYYADYRCRQILGQPLMISAKPDPTDLL